MEQVNKLDQLRIAHVRLQDKASNTQVLQRFKITGIEASLLTAQLRWTGHVIRMNDNRLPKAVLYSQLQKGVRSRGAQRKRYKDLLKATIKA